METKIGIILGSGLHHFEYELKSPKTIYEDKETFHRFKILSGKIFDKDIILYSGRKHFYEGFSELQVLHNINLAKDFGINLIIITNAAGGINTNFKVSDLMLITSHLSFSNKKIPARNNAILYDNNTIDIIKNIAKEEKINLKFGSYCCSTGPAYETRAETKFLTKYGIDAVGMSTIPEIIYANKLGIRTIAFSCITNLLLENSNKITNHQEVIEAGKNAYNNFSKLLKKIILKSTELI